MNIDSEKCLLNDHKKLIYDITPFSHLDYPEKLSCIVWFIGCNMRCAYCYNGDIVEAKSGKYSFEQLLEFLDTRKGLLDAVVLSGGEVLIHDIRTLCEEIKSRGFCIKIDTNGTNPQSLQNLTQTQLVDYVALDYKSPHSKFNEVTASKQFDLFAQSLEILIKSPIQYEVRTTVHTDLLDEEDINCIIDDLVNKGYDKTYFIQEFFDTSSTIGNLSVPSRVLDKSKIATKLKIQYR